MTWMTPTTYIQRFGDAMERLCNGIRPSDDLLWAWISSDDDDRLQEFACANGPAWAQGIVVIDAARILADSPGEGVEHELLVDPIRRCRHGVAHPHPCRECEAEATPVEIAAFMAAEGLAPNAELCAGGYWCVVCGRYLPADEDGLIVHDNVPHPEDMTFDEEEMPQ